MTADTFLPFYYGKITLTVTPSHPHTKLISENYYNFLKNIKISKTKIYRSGEKIKGKIK